MFVLVKSVPINPASPRIKALPFIILAEVELRLFKLYTSSFLWLSRKLTFSSTAEELATQENFQLSGYRFEADKESTRAPRVTRIGLVQNRIVKAPCEEVLDQRDALYKRMTSIIQAAALAKVNVLCFQEAWSKPRCLKITEKVSFNIASEASYAYNLSGQKLIINFKNGSFWRVFVKMKLADK